MLTFVISSVVLLTLILFIHGHPSDAFQYRLGDIREQTQQPILPFLHPVNRHCWAVRVLYTRNRAGRWNKNTRSRAGSWNKRHKETYRKLKQATQGTVQEAETSDTRSRTGSWNKRFKETYRKLKQKIQRDVQEAETKDTRKRTGSWNQWHKKACRKLIENISSYSY